MAGNQGLMSQSISEQLAPTFERYGVKLDNFTVENVSLPEELQKALDTRISMGMAGDAKFTQYQTATAIPMAAQNEGGIAGIGAGAAARRWARPWRRGWARRRQGRPPSLPRSRRRPPSIRCRSCSSSGPARQGPDHRGRL